MRTPITVDRRKRVPLHAQICDEWRRGILSGRFKPGDRMPSTRELAGALRVSRATASIAYDQLVAEGYLEGRRGSGTYVSHRLPERPVRPREGGAARAGPRLSRFAARLAPVARRAMAPAGVINMAAADPDEAMFPHAVWARLLRRHLRRRSPALYRYAPDAAGHGPLREAIAAYLRRSRAVRCDAARVIVVSGSQQALDLCVRVLVDPGDGVAVEEPGYPGARQLATAAGAVVRPVPVDAEGLVVLALPPSAGVVHVTPSHQFPTGASMSVARRLELLSWARARHAVIVEDDYDSEFRYGGAPLPSLQGLDEAGLVVYVGTFSLAMFPGLRIGYLVAPPPLVEPLTRAKWYADRHTPYLEQAALADFIREGHLERHVRRMRRVYKRRRDTLIEALGRHFAGRAALVGDAAGLHVVVRFEGPDVGARAERRGVVVASTRGCYAGAAPENEYVLRFASVSERALAEGVRRLAGRA